MGARTYADCSVRYVLRVRDCRCGRGPIVEVIAAASPSGRLRAQHITTLTYRSPSVTAGFGMKPWGRKSEGHGNETSRAHVDSDERDAGPIVKHWRTGALRVRCIYGRGLTTHLKALPPCDYVVEDSE